MVSVPALAPPPGMPPRASRGWVRAVWVLLSFSTGRGGQKMCRIMSDLQFNMAAAANVLGARSSPAHVCSGRASAPWRHGKGGRRKRKDGKEGRREDAGEGRGGG